MLQHYNTLSGIHEVQKEMTKPEGIGFKISIFISYDLPILVRILLKKFYL